MVDQTFTSTANPKPDSNVVRRMTLTKDVLGHKIFELQDIVANRHLEGLDDSQVEALKSDINALNKHLQPIGEKIVEAGRSLTAEDQKAVARRVGNEGLPILTEEQKRLRKEGKLVSAGSSDDDGDEEEFEEDDGTGNKRTVRRPKAIAKRR